MKTLFFSSNFLREELLPTTFCAGCGIGIISNCFIRAVEELGYKNFKNFVFCSGIGCSSWISSPYFLADSIHTAHGRSIPVATGIKLSKPNLKVVVFGGDGDLLGIGLNHLLQAARRNLEILVVLINNMTYAMTGGQVSPLTPKDLKSTTTPFGNLEPPFDAVNLLSSAGASYVARWTTSHPFKLKESFKEALNLECFSFIEVLSQCPSLFGRRIGLKEPSELLTFLEEKTKKEMKVGVFKRSERVGLSSLIQRQIREIKNKKDEN